MILIYTPKISSRIEYIFSHIFQRMLQKECILSKKVDEFIAHKGPKLSYATQPLGGEFFVKSHGLLSKQNIEKQDITVELWEGIPCFFKTDKSATIPFDIFAASFYQLARYEEYAPLNKNASAHFSYSHSLAFAQNFLHLPIVDLWICKLFEKLRDRFPDLTAADKATYRQQLLIVDEIYRFKDKGVVRTIGGWVEDALHLNFVRIIERGLSVFGLRKDPYDNFKYLIRIFKKYEIPTRAFYSVGAYGTHDKNISPLLKSFEIVVKHLSDYFTQGYLVSYQAAEREVLMEGEKRILSEILKRSVQHAQFHLLHLRLPLSYRYLVEAEVFDDYSMGYLARYGYRAGTSRPFYFYDLEYEQKTPLLIHPFVLSDTYMMKLSRKMTASELESFLKGMLQTTKLVKGNFTFVVHSKNLGEHPGWKGWRRLYESVLETVKNEL